MYFRSSKANVLILLLGLAITYMQQFFQLLIPLIIKSTESVFPKGQSCLYHTLSTFLLQNPLDNVFYWAYNLECVQVCDKYVQVFSKLPLELKRPSRYYAFFFIVRGQDSIIFAPSGVISIHQKYALQD